MPLIRLIIIIIGIYVAYKFIFEFLIPIYRTSKRMQQQFKGMQDRMNQNMNGQADPFKGNPVKKQPSEAGKVNKDYIDFEEVK
jgi:hypothetical protein